MPRERREGDVASLEDKLAGEFGGELRGWQCRTGEEVTATGVPVYARVGSGPPVLVAVIPVPVRGDPEEWAARDDEWRIEQIAHARLVAQSPQLACNLARVIDAARNAGPDAGAAINSVLSLCGVASVPVIRAVDGEVSPSNVHLVNSDATPLERGESDAAPPDGE